MQHSTEGLYVLKQRIERARQSSDILSVLEEIASMLHRDTSSQELYTLLINLFQVLQVLTVENSRNADHLIRTYLLDYLELDSNGTLLQEDVTRQLRECLIAWMEQYDEQEFVALRKSILNALLHRFLEKPSRALCWTFAAIGFREKRVVSALQSYASRSKDDEEKDTALYTLTVLGVPRRRRSHFLKEIHARLQKQVSRDLLAAVFRLASRSSLPVLYETCLDPSSTKSDTILRELFFVVSIIATIADTHDENEDVQNNVWKHIVAYYDQDPQHFGHIVNLGGDIAAQCDSRSVIPDLLRWFEQAKESEQLMQERNPLLLYRLEECVRPRQLVSWQQTENSTALSMLHHSALGDTRAVGRYTTREMNEKEAAWRTLFRMGYSKALDGFDAAVMGESNPYLRNKLCNLFACFQIDPLPQNAVELIKQQYDARTITQDTSGNTSAELAVRLGVIHVAGSSASWQSFEALLSCGLTVNKQPLLVAVQALADVSCVLARQQESAKQRISLSLLHEITHSPRTVTQLAAAKALEEVSREQELPPALLRQLADYLLTERTKRDPYLSSILLAVLTFQKYMPEDLMSQVYHWSTTRNDELAFQAVSFLIQEGTLGEASELFEELKKREDNQQEAASLLSRPDWKAQIVGLLFMEDDERYSETVAELIEHASWSVVGQMIRTLKAWKGPENKRSLPRIIQEALINRVREQHRWIGMELPIIRQVAEILPEMFVRVLWHTYYPEWLPDARAALADALGTLETPTIEARINQVRHLEMLIRDGQYQVRRAAYRGLQRCDAARLEKLCRDWSSDPNRMLRLRAVEAVAWFPNDKELQRKYRHLYDTFATDAEPIVREAATRTFKERRKRQWAELYLAKIEELARTNEFTNEGVLASWPYAEALTRVGDDTTLGSLQSILENGELPPHISHWFHMVYEETKNGWEKAIKKWPHPVSTRLSIDERNEAKERDEPL